MWYFVHVITERSQSEFILDQLIKMYVYVYVIIIIINILAPAVTRSSDKIESIVRMCGDLRIRFLRFRTIKKCPHLLRYYQIVSSLAQI